MPLQTFQSVLLRTVRTTGWLLMILLSLYIVTGFAMAGKLGLGRLVDVQIALVVHRFFAWPLAVIVVLHAATTTYFAMRRWGWIKKK